jgi:hypothetical protein
MSAPEPNTDTHRPAPSGSQLDWGLGEYESTAAELAPVARHVVERAGIERGDHGASVSFEESSVAFVARSPEAYLAGPQAEHPMHIAQRPLLERAGTYEATREQMLAALRQGNEDPAAFRVTSRYMVARITRT